MRLIGLGSTEQISADLEPYVITNQMCNSACIYIYVPCKCKSMTDQQYADIQEKERTHRSMKIDGKAIHYSISSEK
jgi:hypothetical protein